MAEALAVAGGLAAFLQIASSIRKLSIEFKQCVRTIRKAPEEVKNLQRQLSNFSQSLTMFHHTSDGWLDDMEESQEKDERRLHIVGLINECEAVKTGAKRLKKRFFSHPSQSASEIGFLYRIRWYFQKDYVVGLTLMLESAKTSVLLFVTLKICEDLRKRVLELQNALHQRPEESNELKELKRQWRHTRQQLQDQVEYVQSVHQRLDEHIRTHTYSESILGSSVLVVANEAHTIERYFTATIKKEKSISRDSSLLSTQPKVVQNRRPSPGPQPQVRRPPPSTPPPSQPISGKYFRPSKGPPRKSDSVSVSPVSPLEGIDRA